MKRRYSYGISQQVLDNMEVCSNHVLVYPDQAKNEIRITGENGVPLDILLDIDFDKKHNPVSGEVVAMPSYAERLVKVNGFDVRERVKIGDRVYFHFNAIEMATEGNMVFHDEETDRKYYLIPIPLIYCCVGLMKIHAVGEYNLVEPLDDKDLVKNEHGMIFKKANFGILLPTEQKHNTQFGVVRYVGQEVHGEENDYLPGDKILYTQDSDIPLEVEGNLFFRQRHRNIIAKVEDELCTNMSHTK